jgi:hypothetical protein
VVMAWRNSRVVVSRRRDEAIGVSLDTAQVAPEAQMSTEGKIAAPKNGEHVTNTQHEGVFEVVFVNALMQTANIRLVDGTAHVEPNVPWSALSILKKH